MLDYKCEWDEQYPEKPDRIKKPYERCQFYGLPEKCIRLPVSNQHYNHHFYSRLMLNIKNNS